MDYERTKTTSKIASRIELGKEEADSIEYVLAEVAARNKVESDPAISEALESLAGTARKRKRPTVEETSYTLATYVPSVLAHSFLIPNSSEIENSASILSAFTALEPRMRPKTKVNSLLTEKISTPYLPSILAHNLLVCEASTNCPLEPVAVTTLDDLISRISKQSSPKKSTSSKNLTGAKKRLYRSRKFESAVGYFPSILAHTNLNLASISQPATKRNTNFVEPLNDENYLASLSPINAFLGLSSIRVSTGRLHKLNSGDSSNPMETSDESRQPLYSSGTHSDTASTSSGILQHLVQQTQAIAPSTPHKRHIDNEPSSVSPTASKRPRTSLSSSLCMAGDPEPGNHELKIEYLPSVAAHTHFWFGIPEAECLMNIAVTAKKIPRQRKKTAKALEVKVMEQMMENSRSAQSPQRIRPNLTYEEQLEAIARDEIGVYLGKSAFLKKIHGRGRRRQSRLIVFKSPRLNAFSWFIPESTMTETTNNEQLSSVKHDMPKELENKITLSFPKPLLDTSRPYFQLSKTRDDFLSGVRNAIRLSDPAEMSKPAELRNSPELSYSNSYPATADGPSLKVASIQDRKRKRSSASIDTRQPLRKKNNIQAASRKNSGPTDLSSEEVPPLPGSTSFRESIPSNAELAILVPSKGRNIAQSDHSIHAPIYGTNLSNPTSIDTSDSFASDVAPLSIANSSGALNVLASPTTIVDGRPGAMAIEKNSALIQNVMQDMLLQPSSPGLTAGAQSIYGTQGNLAKSNELRLVNFAEASTTTGCDTISGSPRRNHIRPELIPNTNISNSWLPENSEQTHDSLLIQNSVTPDSDASAGVRNISSSVVPDTTSNQEEQRETLSATKDTTSHTTMETTLDSPQNSEFVLEPSLQPLTCSKAAPTIVRINTTGGSVAVLRRKIIMEIIEHCGGVFPGDREIWQPFCDVWKSRIGGGKPDHRTVLAAVKYLIDNGKLRKLKFTFNHEGVATTRSIVTSSEISPTDPKVKDLRQKMIDHVDTSSRLKAYIPEEAKIFMTPVEVVDKPIVKPHQDIFNRSWTNCPKVSEEQVKLQYPAGLKRSSKGLLISQSMEKRRKEKEERQVGLIEDVEEISEPDFETEDYRFGRTLALSGAEGTHQFRWRKFNSITDEIPTPASKGTARIRKSTLADGIAGSSSTRTNTNSGRLQKLNVNSRPRPNFLDQNMGGSGRQSGQRLHQLAKMPVGNAYQQLHFMEVMDEHSNFDKELSPQPVDIIQEQNWRLLADHEHGGLNPHSEGDLLSFQPEYQRPKFGKFKANKIHKIIQEQLQKIGLQYRVAARQRTTKFITAKRPRKSSSDPANRVLRVSSLMDPEHLFHVTTGTFSTSFAGMLDMGEVPDLPSPSMGRSYDLTEKTEVDLPHCLQDVLSRHYDTKLVARMERLVRVGFNPNHDPFLELVDGVRKWELGTPSLTNTISRDWQFINFQLPGLQETLNPILQTSVFIDPGLGGGMKQIRQRNSTTTSPRPVVPAKRPASLSKQPARRSNLARLSATPIPAIEVPVDADGRAFKRITLRGPKVQAVSSEDDDRILIAVLVVRTLVGGSEQYIDWVLLARMFGSEFSERLLHRRWVSVRVRYKRNLEKLQADIQDMFLQAYENGTIPPLDFDNYDNYDWNSLIDWTMKNLDTPLNNLNKDLPRTRTELDDLFELRKPSVVVSELALFYELESLCSVPRRQVVIHRKPHLVPVHTASTNTEESSLHEIAKTWVRANVMASDKGYDANLARDKLISLGEPNVEAAVKDLLSSRVILHANKGRLIPGRNYDMTDYCLTRLRRKIDANTFREAAVYKSRLDVKFEKEGSVALSYYTRDAEVMTALNLAANGRISILPKDPPMEMFGLVDNGYRTQHMNKARLNFDIELKPTASYIRGNPLLPLPPPPGSVFCTVSSSPKDTAQSHRASVGSEPIMERFPFWIGIDNTLVPAAWDLALAAVLSLAVIQPGVSASEVAKTLRPALEAWEVALIFQWCVRAGVATWADDQAGQSANGGVKVAEWWWLVCGSGDGGPGREMDAPES